jgi:hypothetical protein
MKRMSLLLALLLLVASTAGCGCCSWWRPAPAPYAAACPPAPPCDPCATAPVTYGYGPAPPAVVPYTPPPQW